MRETVILLMNHLQGRAPHILREFRADHGLNEIWLAVLSNNPYAIHRFEIRNGKPGKESRWSWNRHVVDVITPTRHLLSWDATGGN